MYRFAEVEQEEYLKHIAKLLFLQRPSHPRWWELTPDSFARRQLPRDHLGSIGGVFGLLKVPLYYPGRLQETMEGAAQQTCIHGESLPPEPKAGDREILPAMVDTAIREKLPFGTCWIPSL
jgi:hypothetical protein